jgi:DNA-binding MarR family transcriptional regulator
MKPYDHLISILDAFIEEFDGGMRIRGIKTALLIEKATKEGRGISLSEIARETDAPLENVRRHMAKYVEQGSLRYVEDPDDDRVTRVVQTREGIFAQAADRVSAHLDELELRDRKE